MLDAAISVAIINIAGVVVLLIERLIRQHQRRVERLRNPQVQQTPSNTPPLTPT